MLCKIIPRRFCTTKFKKKQLWPWSFTIFGFYLGPKFVFTFVCMYAFFMMCIFCMCCPRGVVNDAHRDLYCMRVRTLPQVFPTKNCPPPYMFPDNSPSQYVSPPAEHHGTWGASSLEPHNNTQTTILSHSCTCWNGYHIGGRRHGQEAAHSLPLTTSRRLPHREFILGPRWGTFVPRSLICPPLKKIQRAPMG